RVVSEFSVCHLSETPADVLNQLFETRTLRPRARLPGQEQSPITIAKCAEPNRGPRLSRVLLELLDRIVSRLRLSKSVQRVHRRRLRECVRFKSPRERIPRQQGNRRIKKRRQTATDSLERSRQRHWPSDVKRQRPHRLHFIGESGRPAGSRGRAQIRSHRR